MMLNLLEEASIDIISLQEIKMHLRLDHCDEDDYLKTLCQAATNIVEKYLGRTLLTKKWQRIWYQGEEPEEVSKINLPYPPLVEILSVSRILPNDIRDSIKRYSVDTSGSLPILVCRGGIKIIEVIYKAGFGDYPKSIPAAIHQAILLTITDLYENRGNSKIQTQSVFKALLQGYRLIGLK